MSESPSQRDLLTTRYDERRPILKALAKNLSEELAEQLADTSHIDRCSFRVKKTDSFIAKCFERSPQPPYGDPLVEVEDQVAGRILVFFLDDIAVAQDAVQRIFTPVETERRQPDRHNEFDYESFHGVYGVPPQLKPRDWDSFSDMPETFELQIRTLFQHAYAEPQHDVAYKPTGVLAPQDKRELAWIAASAWGADHALLRVWKRVNEQQNPPDGRLN